MNQPVTKTIIFSLLAFLLSTGSSYALTTYLYSPANGGPLTPVATPGIGGGLNLDPSLPRTAECPTNGQMFTEQEKEVWETRRPLYVMIENSVDARPQSGLGSADIVYEAVVEGGITRFGAVFYCGVAAQDTLLAPLRSARTHFINIASEYNYPIYQHVGGANRDGCTPLSCDTDEKVDALGQIRSYGWHLRNDLDAQSIGLPVFRRFPNRLGADRELAAEHTMTSTSATVYNYMAEKRDWTNLSPEGDNWIDDFIPWTFKDDADVIDRGSKNPSFGFWDNKSDFNVVWNYDSSTNTYKRDNGGKAHIDLNDDAQFDAKVVIVQFVSEEGSVDNGKHIHYEMIGKGEAFIFQDGEVIEASWKKLSRETRTTFTDSKGKEIELNRGPIWVEILPMDNTVSY